MRSDISGNDAHLAELVRATAAADRDSFERLYRATHPTVLAQAFGTLRSSDHAADVVQEVFTHVWQHADRYDPAAGSVRAWLRVMTKRRSIDRVRQLTRQRARDTHALLLPDAAVGIDDIWQRVRAEDDVTELRDSLARLSEKQREAVTLAFVQGHTHAQIAALLELPLGTVKGRIRDGLLSLRVHMTLR